MQSSKRSQLRRKSGLRIGPKARDLRLARRWTQAELADRLGLSQARLSEIERGAGSFTAEQFVEILQVFNVHVSHFAPADARSEDESLQNVLARLGATHLHESEARPSDRVVDANEAIREVLATGSPRLVTALAPLLVRNLKTIRLPRIESSLREVGLDHRLGWLVANVAQAIGEDLARGRPPREVTQRYRRAAVVLEAYRESTQDRRPGTNAPDVLDEDIRSKKTLEEVRAYSSPFSRGWNIVTRLQPSDFLDALRAARAGN